MKKVGSLELANRLSLLENIPLERSKSILDTIITEIQNELLKGGSVTLIGLCTLKSYNKGGRNCYIPKQNKHIVTEPGLCYKMIKSITMRKLLAEQKKINEN